MFLLPILRSRPVRVLFALAMGAGVLVTAPATASATTPTAAPLAAVPAAAATAPAGARTAITPGLRGWDSLTVETPAQIICLSNAGYAFDAVNTNGVRWQDEYNAAAAAGMKVVLFQGYDSSTWKTPSQAQARAISSRDKALAARYPAGAQIFLNVESNVNVGVTPTAMLTWINNWAAVIRNAGYLPGVYVGVPQILTAAQVNSLAGIVFWRSASGSAPQAGRGFVMRQTSISRSACGIPRGIDPDVAGADRNGAQLIGAAFPAIRRAPTQPGTFVPLSPSRLLDTRHGLGAATGAVRPSGRVNLQITGPFVPAGASAVVLNVTATESTRAGNISVTPTGQPIRVSNVNFVAGQTVPNLVTVKVGTGGRVTLVNGSAGTVQMIADVSGYYLGGTAGVAGAFTPVTPSRLLDTRPHPVVAGSTTPVQVTGRVTGAPPTTLTIPPAGSVSSAVVNVTAVLPKTAGYLKAFGDGPAPNASTLNFVAGQTVPNLAMVPVSAATGRISLINGSNHDGRTDLLADVAGYFRAGTPTSTGAFAPLTPTRILDTRSDIGSIGAVPADSAVALLISGAGRAVPANATAVAINVTVTAPAGLGYLSVFPADRSAPLASNLNFVRGQTVANLVIVPIGADGKIVLDNQSTGSTDLIGDVAGYFVG